MFWNRLLAGLAGVILMAGCSNAVSEPAMETEYKNPMKVWPAEIFEVKGEQLQLSPDKPQSFSTGTKLKAIQPLGPGRGTTAPYSVDGASIVVRFKGKILAEGQDYLVDKTWGALGIGTSPCVTTKDTVEVDYKYSVRRIDSFVSDKTGKKFMVKGTGDLTIPQPPAIEQGQTRIANVFVDYFSSGVKCEIFKITPGYEPRTQTTSGLIPNTLAKIKGGQKVKILCWGDSVTEGGDASSPELRYTSVFSKMLTEKFPDADMSFNVIAVGGSNSRQWLDPQTYKHPSRSAECDFNRIVNYKADLVTIEFVNDAGMTKDDVNNYYGRIISGLKAAGTEVILITPHFTMPGWMGFKSMREPERRPYVLALAEFAKSNHIALADASSRWGSLSEEGIPYITYLKNGLNHPDDRGHRLFAEELIKCFE